MNLQQDHYQSRFPPLGAGLIYPEPITLGPAPGRRPATRPTLSVWGKGWRQPREHLSVDVLAPGSMKTVAKHDNQWKLQKQETHQVVERICERVSALLMRASVSFTIIIHLRDGNWPWLFRQTGLKFRASALETLWSRRIRSYGHSVSDFITDLSCARSTR